MKRPAQELSMSKILTLSAAGALATVLLLAGQADAHAKLVSASPAASATVASPRAIVLTFSERMTPAFSSFDVVDSAGAAVPVKTSVSKDGKTITGTPAGALRPGGYTVNWRVASADGHRMTGSTGFVVR
jgi:copper resistance protein C